MTSADPREIIADSPMSPLQIIAVALCVMLNALDGFDVLAISFAAPGIAAEWQIDRAALGLVLSMELIGMAVGSLVLGNLADRFGRRPTILLCLAVMAVGMYLAAIANNLVNLSVIRFFTGLGIGGLLAAVNAMVAEQANRRYGHMAGTLMAVTLMALGYPLGAILGGSIASVLLVKFDWRSVFIFGALATLVMIPLTWLFLNESVEYLTQKRPQGALQKINRILSRMGHSTVERLPDLTPEQSRAGIAELFSPLLIRITLLLTLIYFTHMLTFYFVLKWIPKIVVDMGFMASAAGGVLVWANVGGALGSFILSMLTQRVDVRKLVIGALLIGSVMVTVFGRVAADLQLLSLFAAMAGFFTNSAIVGLYAIIAQSFPSRVRAGGTGLVIGVGRGGAALGPILAGVLFQSGQSLPDVAMVMASGSLVAAVALIVVGKASAKLAV